MIYGLGRGVEITSKHSIGFDRDKRLVHLR